MESPDRALELVVSYAHEDETLKQQFLKHLGALRRQGVIRAWHDRDIDAGTEWKTAIDSQFETADIIVLLVSPDFIDSDYCYEIEMKRALERHDAGECRVIPVFLRACDWKGAPFGKLQGLPDDAIPVVSTQWASRDDAFLRVVQGIRQVAEKLRRATRSAARPPMPPATVVATDAIEPALTESIDDSGPGVLLNDKYFEADAVVEIEDDHFEVRIASASAEEDAELRALRGDSRYHGPEASFAYGNDAFLARVESTRAESTAGRHVWRIELKRRDTNQNVYDVANSDTATVEQILTRRAGRILLAEEPAKTRERGTPDGDFFFSGGRRDDQVKQGVFQQVWAQVSRDIVKFLRFARLSAVYELKMTETCDDILELRLGPLRDQQLHVRFRGRRKDRWSEKTLLIEVEGDCPLPVTTR